MAADMAGIRAMLDDWHDAGADRVDPLRFHQLDALARRVPVLQGAVREVVEARLVELVDGYAACVRISRMPVSREVVSATSPLVELTNELARVAQQRSADSAPQAGEPPAAHVAKPAMLHEARQVWSAVRLRSQLRQSLEPGNEEAGPLNSERLVQRALMGMRDVSPGYLQHFMAYVDVLSGLQQVVEGSGAAMKIAANKPARARKRRD